MLLIRYPLAYFQLERWQADAIWWSFPVSSVCSMAMALAYYRWGGWRRAHMLRPDHHEVATPAEVPATPPSPVADPSAETDDDRAGLAYPQAAAEPSPDR